jgi:26S proteasome regulatory subunit N13
MSISPIITFKAGQCEVDVRLLLSSSYELLTNMKTASKPYKVKPIPKPGYIYLYSEDGIIRHSF